LLALTFRDNGRFVISAGRFWRRRTTEGYRVSRECGHIPRLFRGSPQPMYFPLQFADKLRPLLREDIEQSPKLAVLDVFGSIPKSVLSLATRCNQVVEYGNHFRVIHMNPPSLDRTAI